MPIDAQLLLVAEVVKTRALKVVFLFIRCIRCLFQPIDFRSPELHIAWSGLRDFRSPEMSHRNRPTPAFPALALMKWDVKFESPSIAIPSLTLPMNSQQFFSLLRQRSPIREERLAFAEWLDQQGESWKAKFVRHRCELMRIGFGTRLYQFHANAVEDLRSRIDDSWLNEFATDLTLHEKRSLSCYPMWSAACPEPIENVPTLEIADGLSVYFSGISFPGIITNQLLEYWGMPFEYVVSQTVEFWDGDLQSWECFDSSERDRVYLSEDCGDDGSWGHWFYARPEMWQAFREAGNEEVELSSAPALLPLDLNRILLTAADDRLGLEQMAHVARDLLKDEFPVTVRPLVYHDHKNWDYLQDANNPAATVWQESFGDFECRELQKRELRGALDVIDDPIERELGRKLIHLRLSVRESSAFHYQV